MEQKAWHLKQWLCLISALFAFVLGVVCYIFFNPDANVTKWIGYYFNVKTIYLKPEILHIIIKSFAADFFWSLSFTLAVQSIMNFFGRQKLYLLYCSVLGVLFELLQLFGIVRGVFDIFDIIVYIAGSFTAIAVIKLIWRLCDE